MNSRLLDTLPDPAPLPDGLRLVPIGRDRAAEVVDLAAWVFGIPVSAKAEMTNWPEMIDWSRTFAVITADAAGQSGQSGRVVATAGSWAFDIPVPGGRIKVGGLTFVGVRPEFRRQGILRAMIQQHFRDCIGREEPVSMLTASESEIYPRFGYGLVNWTVFLTLPQGANLRDVPGWREVSLSFETADVQRHGDLTAALHREVSEGPQVRPGWTPDVTPGMARARFFEPLDDPMCEPLRILIARRGEQATGFALFRRRTTEAWGGPEKRQAEVSEIVSTDPATTRALWHGLTNLDLTGSTTTPGLPMDDPLLALLTNPRAAKPTIEDEMYARIIDLPGALAARRYSAPVDLVLDVSDELIPANAGRWRLIGSPTQAEVQPVPGDQADISIGIRDLASLYLGGMSLASLLDAGLVTEHSPGAAAGLAAAMASFRTPGESRGF